jgi:DNA invertase Pin-like site-specific DNA recombinase/predicted DNA-binding protein
MTRAAIYVRVSTVRQAERDLSLPDQIAQCQAYCERQGWEVAGIFSEPGASALDEDRPVFQEMIYKATRSDKPFDYIVVHSLSRFSRDALHSELYVRKLRKAGVELVSITQTMTPDASGEMFRKLLNVFDEHQSRENAKHVHRAMCENARQGFWNGARPPFGYGLKITERRGAKDKKVLVVNEDEAKVVRKIFCMATGVDGHPMGVKAIASHLNKRGISRRGHSFGTSSIHEVLTSTSYIGRHYFNKRDSRNQKPRPPSEWIELAVPKIVDEEIFNAAQALLRSRNPRRMPPRVANGPTLLAGLARCGHCGAALIQNTGKSGAYRYYCCSRKLKEGATSCRGLRMRMDALDRIVIEEVSKRVLEPKRLTEMLAAYVQTAARKGVAEGERLVALRRELGETEARLTRAMEMIESGLEDVNDRLFRERYTGLKVRRAELESEVAALRKRMSSGEPIITPEKVARLGVLLREKLNSGAPEFRQAYARLLLDEVTVNDQEIRISGSKDVLARCASGEADMTTPAVLSFVPEWRARHDSNVRPLPSEGVCS